MIKSDSSPQEEYRQSFLRHLANRLEAIQQRIHRFRFEGWEFGGMSLLHDEVQRLAGSSGRYNLIEPSHRLMTLEQMLGEHIARKRLPDPQQGDRLLAQLASVTGSLAPQAKSPQPFEQGGAAQEPSVGHQVPDARNREAMPSSIRAPTAPIATPSNEALRPSPFGWTAARHIYQLSDFNALASELRQRLKAEGYAVEMAASVGELSSMLKSVTPELVLIDPSRMSDLPVVGTVCRDNQQASHDKNERIRLIAMAGQDNLKSRLDARRAGVDALLFPPFNTVEVMKQVQAQLKPVADEKVRVLIVEDDRSQALFAQSVLNNAGMQAQVELEAMHVLEALEAFRPDLVLMDMHMPDANGVELTALIREHPAFMTTPIVFLTGENDPDARLEAINAGGDDFLSKPIRPKILIASVQNRVRRVRAVEKRDRMLGARDEATGLYRRAYLFDRVNDAIGASSDQHSLVGGALFLEIDGAAALRDDLGLVALEDLLAAAGRVLADAVGEQHVAAVINDNAFVVLATELDDNALDALARRLRDQLMQHPFDISGKPMRLSASVGICPLRFGFDDASALLNTAERTCREARINDQGIRRYEPAKPTELNPEASLARQLREAISSDGFGLIYQPIAAMQGSHEPQYQTLLRMRDSSGRLLPAAEILPVAERAGLMIDIDRWVLTRAMQVVSQQRDLGYAVRLFIPQAMTTFAAKEQDIFLKAELAAHELSGSALVLECRLADALLNPPALRSFISAMRANGVQLCVGQYEHTDEASRLLEDLPLGFIKLAPKYVAADLTQAMRGELRMLSDRAHRFGIQVIGHRVEDADTAATLWLAGVDFIQGNLVQSATDELKFDFNSAVL
ncbi:MAG TPA: EAL domain-containing protein [Xanthomonadaceae bacterium]|nr:EAL domain-containing protein [Xanthomonadaceae bacterium]